MELQLDNITCRRKKHKRLNKIESELPHRQNNYTQNEDLYTGTIKNEEEKLQKEYIHKKKHKLYDSQAAMVSETSATISYKNNTGKECFVDNTVGYPKKKHKKLYNSDLEVLSSEIHLPSKQKLNEINSDSGIDVQNNAKLKKVNRKGSIKKKLKNIMVAVSLPLVKSDHRRDFKSDEELMDVFLNENDGCVGPKTKTDSFGISSQLDNLGHGDRKQNRVSTVGRNNELLLQSKKCDQSIEGHLRKKDSLYKTTTTNSDSVEESCSRQETIHKAERQIAVESDSNNCSHHYGKVKRKTEHKNKLENHFAQGVEEFDCASYSDFANKKNKKKKKNKGTLEEIKLLQEGNNCSDYIVERNNEPLLQSKKCDQSIEGHLRKKDSLYKTPKTNSDSVEESYSRQETIHKAERQIEVESDSNNCSHHYGKVKRKMEHKNKLENHFAQGVEEFDCASYSDFANKKNKGTLEEIKLLEEGNSCASVYCSDLSYTKNVKKRKHKNKLQNSEQGNDEGFTDLYTDKINKKKKHKSELDEIKEKILTHAVKKFKPNSVASPDSPACVNKKVEVLGSNELKADSNQTTRLNILKDKKEHSHTALRKHINYNKELDNLRDVLLSSALKSIGCKTSDSNDIYIDHKKSIDSGKKNVLEETNQSSYNKKKKLKDKKRGKIKEKNIYKSKYDLNRKSSNTQNSNVDLIRKALIAAAVQRIKLNEKKQRNAVLADCSEYEVKPQHKNKKKSKVEKSVDKKNKINEMEIMRSSLISNALAKMNGTNKIN